MAVREPGKPESGWRQRLYVIVFESDTQAGRRFDLLLIIAILASVFLVTVDSVESLRVRYGAIFGVLEWTFTLLFTLEYLTRLAIVRRPWRYATSFFGVIDLLSILPTYIGFFVPGGQYLVDIRALRLLRIFRILKLTPYLAESGIILQALIASRRKIAVFLSTVVIAVLILATLMYLVEGPENGFTSIPRSFYWGIVTITTVGYGDMTPKTPLGQVIASVVMILGYGILAVPTGIVSAEFTARAMSVRWARTCPQCLAEDVEPDARYCRHCGGDMAAGTAPNP